MIPVKILYHAPFVAVTVRANGQSLTFENVLIDTGSAASLFRIDDLAQIGVLPELTDIAVTVEGIGGTESVIQKPIDALEVGFLIASPFTIQLGKLDYSLAIDGILGFDFLTQVGTQMNFRTLTLTKE